MLRYQHEIYLEGEQLDNEARNKEFKKGGGDYLKNDLKKDVSKYVCAFLNSGEEGTLYVGVNDRGKNSNKNVAFLSFTSTSLQVLPVFKSRLDVI